MEKLKEIAQHISEVLEHCDFDNVTDSSGYYTIRKFADGTERMVDVYKSTNDGNPHYIVFCSYEDEDHDYKYSDDLSLDSLVKVLEEIYKESLSLLPLQL